MTEPVFRPDLPSFARHPSVFGFLDTWHTWRGDKLMPRRGQVKTHQIADLMRGMMMMDVPAPEKLIFRYAGSIYQDLYGFDFTGLNYLDITEPQVRHIRSKRLWGVVAQPAAAVWTVPRVDQLDFIGASVPIAPDDPAHPPKIMQVVIPMRELTAARAKAWNAPDNVTFGDRFRYVDIGAGKPDTGVEA